MQTQYRRATIVIQTWKRTVEQGRCVALAIEARLSAFPCKDHPPRPQISHAKPFRRYLEFQDEKHEAKRACSESFMTKLLI